MKAFGQVTEAGNKHSKGLIGFYGGFTYRESFNLVLEFAKGGTLDDFFQRDERPATRDISNLWEAFFETIHGLMTIHEKPVGRSSSDFEYLTDLLVHGSGSLPLHPIPKASLTIIQVASGPHAKEHTSC